MRPFHKSKRRRLHFASQIHNGDGRLDAALERVKELTDDVCQVLILGRPEGIILANVEVYGRRLRIYGRAGHVTVAASVPWRFINAAIKADIVRPGKSER